MLRRSSRQSIFYQPFNFISERTQSLRWITAQRQRLGQFTIIQAVIAF